MTAADLDQYLMSTSTSGKFSPYASYDRECDAMTFMISNEPEHRKRLNSRVTVYLSDATGDLVGCKVKGIQRVLEDIGWFDAHVTDGKVKLSFLFLSLHGVFDDDDDARKFYRTLGKFAGAHNLDVNTAPAAV